MIAVINYKSGNVGSLTSAFDRLQQDYVVTDDPVVIRGADRVILPGQGRFGQVMRELEVKGLDDVIKDLTQPFLGICVGMQILFEQSEEDPEVGLSIIPGTVTRFSNRNPIPQMGWNALEANGANLGYVYFVHSYYVPASSRYTVASTNYGEEIAAIIQQDNYVGMQFHPEKSGIVGMQLLEQFCTAGTMKVKPFEIWPAIDIINGKCVRLTQGKFDEQTTYDTDPLMIAKQFDRDGVAGIHIVDLDAAKSGEPKNMNLIKQIANAISIPIEVGGGIRSVGIAQEYLEAGIARVIIGTAAFTKPELVKELIEKFGPEKVVLGIDIKDGKPAIRGWKDTVNASLDVVIEQFRAMNVRTIIVTDISKDGMLAGPNLALIKEVMNNDIEVVVSGGVTTAQDINDSRVTGAKGVIIGKAIYEGKLNLQTVVHCSRDALQCVSTAGLSAKIPSGLTKRIIPCMDIANGRVVKGAKFTELQDAGDPVELAKVYSTQGADELVFLDINATLENRSTLYSLVKEVAANVTIPFTVGGGIRTIQDIEQLLRAGADKVSIGSAAVTDFEFVRSAVEKFGSQCIVISVDPKWNNQAKQWEIYIRGGRKNTGMNVIDFVKNMEVVGVGELLVNSVDKDGMKEGYDIALLKAARAAVNIPIIASSGVGSQEDFADAFIKAECDAALAASVFHYKELSVKGVKEYLNEKNITVRL